MARAWQSRVEWWERDYRIRPPAPAHNVRVETTWSWPEVDDDNAKPVVRLRVAFEVSVACHCECVWLSCVGCVCIQSSC